VWADTVTQWVIYDAYLKEINEASATQDDKKKGGSSDEDGKKKASESDPIYSEAMKFSERSY
jgi:hypothetical protein